MKTRPSIISALFFCLVFLAVAVTWRTAEPRYEGRTLTRWIEAARVGDYPDDPPPEVIEAQAAVRAIGPRAFPTLLRLLKSEDPTWKVFLSDVIEKQSLLHVRFHFANEQHEQALRGLLILGSNAAPIIPELRGMLAETNSALLAARALATMGSAAVPALREGLRSSNAIVQAAACEGLFALPPSDARAALPDLLVLRHDPSPPVAFQAVRMLGWLMPPGEFMPILREALSQPNTRGAAWMHILALGTNAEPLIPILKQQLDDPGLSSFQRLQLTNVLRAVAPSR